MTKKERRIAILGAGGLGACTALELASRGYQIDLYEEHSEPIKKASFVNEGKVHLGFIYAMDRDFHTSREMIIGALHFLNYLRRWIDVAPEKVISTPFYYLVHKDSLMNGDQLLVHYRKCIDFFDEAKNHFRSNYLGLYDRIDARKLGHHEFGTIADPEYIQDVFLTTEHSVEPRFISTKLTEALTSNPSINLILNSKVTSVTRKGEMLEVTSQKDGLFSKAAYQDVVNSSWNSLLQIDQTMGIDPLHSWSFRYKFGNKILIPFQADDFYSCTMVQGPFGDSVNFQEKGGFFSWYPIGRTGWSESINPPDWDTQYSDEERLEIFDRSFAELTKRIPTLRDLKFQHENVSPVGGVIFALGNTDVDKEESRLHTRHEVGIRSFDGYHSVNTGKYTLIPYLAVKVADRLEGKA